MWNRLIMLIRDLFDLPVTRVEARKKLIEHDWKDQ